MKTAVARRKRTTEPAAEFSIAKWREDLAEEFRRGIELERERCAQLVEQAGEEVDCIEFFDAIADEIRNRGMRGWTQPKSQLG